MLYCPSCGVKVLPEARFCVACGAPLTAPAATAPATPEPHMVAPAVTAAPAPVSYEQTPAPADQRASAPRPPARRRRAVVAALIAVVVVVVGAGGWVLARKVPAVGNLVGVVPSTLTAPETLAGGWTTQTAWAKGLADPRAATNDKLYQRARDADAANVSATFNAAAAVVQDYQKNDMGDQITIRAVRAQAPVYWVHNTYTQTATLGIGLPMQEVVTVGSVTCHVTHTATTPGTTESTDNTYSECMRTSANLTVWTSTRQDVPAAVAAIVQSAWERVGGPNDTAPAWPKGKDASMPLTAPASFGGGMFIPSTSTGASNGSERYKADSVADALSLNSVYGAAAAYSATFTDAAMEKPFTVSAVRAWSPLAYVRYEDIERLQRLAPLQQVVTVGDVSCVVENFTVAPGGDPAGLQPVAQSCMRSGPGLTVFVDHIAKSLGPLPAVAALVDEAWKAASVG